MSDPGTEGELDLSDPYVQAWIANQLPLMEQQPLPDWSGSYSSGGYIPTDIDTQRDQLDFERDKLKHGMDPLVAALSGMISPDAMAPVRVGGSNEGETFLRNTIARGGDSAQAFMAALILEESMSPDQAFQAAQDAGFIPQAEGLVDASGNPVMDDKTQQQLMADNPVAEEMRQWANQAWDKYLQDSPGEEVPSTLAQKFMDYGFQNDPTAQYTPDMVDPSLAGMRSESSSAEEMVRRMQQSGPALEGVPSPATRLGYVPDDKSQIVDPTASGVGLGDEALQKAIRGFIDEDGVSDNRRRMREVQLGDVKGEDSGVEPETARQWSERSARGAQFDQQLRSTRSKRDERDAGVAARNKTATGQWRRKLQAGQQKRGNVMHDEMMQRARAGAAARFLTSQGRTPFSDEWSARTR